MSAASRRVAAAGGVRRLGAAAAAPQEEPAPLYPDAVLTAPETKMAKVRKYVHKQFLDEARGACVACLWHTFMVRFVPSSCGLSHPPFTPTFKAWIAPQQEDQIVSAEKGCVGKISSLAVWKRVVCCWYRLLPYGIIEP